MSLKDDNRRNNRIIVLAKCFVEWGIAIVITFLIINIICFGYERQPGWHDTPNGASLAVREPYSWMVHGTEGFSISKLDGNGYSNPILQLADDYVLMMGASNTQAKEISPNLKYTVLVNDALSDDSKLHTYNIACDGNFLPDQIRHFKAAMEAFPHAKAVTIEIFETDYSPKEIEESLKQPDFDPMDSAVYFENMSIKEKVKNYTKSFLPMLSKIKNNIETVKKEKSSGTQTQIEIGEYSRSINKALELIRSECDAPIVFIYHPGTIINTDGTLSLKYSQTWDVFKEACNNNNIDVIDSGNDFLKYYEEKGVLPYGFMNTSLGEGHLNSIGHKILADEIVEYLEEQE